MARFDVWGIFLIKKKYLFLFTHEENVSFEDVDLRWAMTPSAHRHPCPAEAQVSMRYE